MAARRRGVDQYTKRCGASSEQRPSPANLGARDAVGNFAGHCCRWRCCLALPTCRDHTTEAEDAHGTLKPPTTLQPSPDNRCSPNQPPDSPYSHHIDPASHYIESIQPPDSPRQTSDIVPPSPQIQTPLHSPSSYQAATTKQPPGNPVTSQADSSPHTTTAPNQPHQQSPATRNQQFITTHCTVPTTITTTDSHHTPPQTTSPHTTTAPNQPHQQSPATRSQQFITTKQYTIPTTTTTTTTATSQSRHHSPPRPPHSTVPSSHGSLTAPGRNNLISALLRQASHTKG
ncbi:hypothetical protein E2C01_019963 [Portunus trituberculatus]|uniref:Uncharacterized protein n=1 Tax=Portunus trituberculatus TaxID=210409 RepID=A0A5B7E0T9_PORTR|nr:hypothetical protein [Portunus trituberculatus]